MRMIKSGNSSKGVESTGIAVDDNNNMSGIGTLGCGAITTTGDITTGSSNTINGVKIKTGGTNFGSSAVQTSFLLCTDGDLLPNLSAGSNNNIGIGTRVGKYWNGNDNLISIGNLSGGSAYDGSPPSSSVFVGAISGAYCNSSYNTCR